MTAVRESSNPVFGNLSKAGRGQGYASFGGATQTAMLNQPGYGQPGFGPQGYGQPGFGPQGYDQSVYGAPQEVVDRPMTIDDVVTKTAITLGVIVLLAVAAFAAISVNVGLALPLLLAGGIGGFITVLVATFGKKMDSAPVTITYAAFEGLFVGAVSFVFTSLKVGGTANAGAMIFQAVAATLGVFAGMLVVYKTGAIRVTPRFTRMIVAGIFGVAALALVNLVAAFFIPGGLGLRDGGTMAIIFSLVCIGLAAFSFLIDFDAADQMIRQGAPSKMAWGVALGLAVTLVWLYVEILRLLSYFRD